MESDVKKASDLTSYYIEKLAINGFAYLYDYEEYLDKQPIKRIEEITDKISEMLEELYQEALTLLKNNQALLKTIAKALFEKEILVWEDICQLSHCIDT